MHAANWTEDIWKYLGGPSVCAFPDLTDVAKCSTSLPKLGPFDRNRQTLIMFAENTGRILAKFGSKLTNVGNMSSKSR